MTKIRHYESCIEYAYRGAPDYQSVCEFVMTAFQPNIITPRFYVLPVDGMEWNQRVYIAPDQIPLVLRALGQFPTEDATLQFQNVYQTDPISVKLLVFDASTSKAPNGSPINNPEMCVKTQSAPSRTTNSSRMKYLDNYTCFLCQFKGSQISLQSAHIVPLKEFKDKQTTTEQYYGILHSDYTNTLTLCAACHSGFDNGKWTIASPKGINPELGEVRIVSSDPNFVEYNDAVRVKIGINPRIIEYRWNFYQEKLNQQKQKNTPQRTVSKRNTRK